MKYNKPYEEQYQRIKRLRKNINSFAYATDENFENAIDAFTSFFIQCYHLRDWLIKSNYSKDVIDSYIKNSAWLSLCRDIANNQKHQKIDRYKPKNDFVKHEEFGVSTPITRHYDYFIHKKARFGIDVWEFGTPIDVIEVANKCIEDWENLIKQLVARDLSTHEAATRQCPSFKSLKI